MAKNMYFDDATDYKGDTFVNWVCNYLIVQNNVFMLEQQPFFNQKSVSCAIFVNFGLITRLIPAKITQNTIQTKEENELLFSSYKLENLDPEKYPHDPSTNAVFSYLSDLLFKKAVDSSFEINGIDKQENTLLLVLNLYPDNGQALSALAKIRYNQGNVREAVNLLEKSIKNMPQFRDSYFLLANIYKDVFGDDAKSKQLLQKYQELENKNKLPI
jgi:tetratricopeptide (TPR) repeat protein